MLLQKVVLHPDGNCQGYKKGRLYLYATITLWLQMYVSAYRALLWLLFCASKVFGILLVNKQINKMPICLPLKPSDKVQNLWFESPGLRSSAPWLVLQPRFAHSFPRHSPFRQHETSLRSESRSCFPLPQLLHMPCSLSECHFPLLTFSFSNFHLSL